MACKRRVEDEACRDRCAPDFALLCDAIQLLLRRKLPLQPEDVWQMLRFLENSRTEDLDVLPVTEVVNCVERFLDYLRDTFDTLYAEGRDSPKMMSIGLHCRLAGRPGRAAAIERFLDHIEKHERVWMARRIDIASHWIDQHPSTR